MYSDQEIRQLFLRSISIHKGRMVEFGETGLTEVKIDLADMYKVGIKTNKRNDDGIGLEIRVGKPILTRVNEVRPFKLTGFTNPANEMKVIQNCHALLRAKTHKIYDQELEDIRNENDKESA